MGAIQVNYVAMEDAATAIRNASAQIEDRLSELESKLANIDWEGQDKVAYEAHKAEWKKALLEMNQILHQIGGAVQTARTGYGDVEQAGARAWG